MADEEKLPQYGGYEMILKVSKLFYDRVYDHPWFSQFFKHVPQEHIEKQQTDFIFDALGGMPKRYMGRMIKDAHEHIMIGEEIYQLRGELMAEAFKEANAPIELIQRWEKIDLAFKNAMLKSDLSDCKKRFFTDNILDFENPNKIKKAA